MFPAAWKLAQPEISELIAKYEPDTRISAAAVFENLADRMTLAAMVQMCLGPTRESCVLRLAAEASLKFRPGGSIFLSWLGRARDPPNKTAGRSAVPPAAVKPIRCVSELLAEPLHDRE
jgi:hypothetical protein